MDKHQETDILELLRTKVGLNVYEGLLQFLIRDMPLPNLLRLLRLPVLDQHAEVFSKDTCELLQDMGDREEDGSLFGGGHESILPYEILEYRPDALDMLPTVHIHHYETLLVLLHQVPAQQ